VSTNAEEVPLHFSFAKHLFVHWRFLTIFS
jgi:hypothetical protein